MLVWVRDKRCQPRPIELLGWSLSVEAAATRLQPVCQQLYPHMHAGRCVGRVALSPPLLLHIDVSCQ